jgi:multidrug efflux pump
MTLSSLSINRPVLATVFSISIVLFGVIGLRSLGVREYPSVDPPVITVSTSYTGANADVIETQITEPLEEAINSVAGIKNLTSTTRDGRSTIKVEFDLSIDLETAANDVRDKVGQARRSLPPDADPPIVNKADADARPIIFINIQSNERSLLELTDFADNTFKEQLQTINGVSDIQVWGSKKYAMRMWMDPDKLAAYGLTPLDVQQALSSENVELPSGSIEGDDRELTVRTQGRLISPSEFNDLIIRDDGVSKIRFRNVGYAELGPENLRTALKRDGVPMVGNAIIPQPNSNHLEIAAEVYKRLEKIQKDLPEDISWAIGFDKTTYIQASIDEVEQTIYVAFALVTLIIFLFLRNWRTTLIPVVVIPISLIGAFFVMYLAGFSINVLTLLGIVLAIGLVVDDAVVVLENIYAKIEQGLSPVEAAKKGAAEIFFAVIATTLALVAVFMPVIFLEGLTGRLFREFGLTLTGAVVISSFVALTLTPMLSSKLLHKGIGENRFYQRTERFFKSLARGYRETLESFMRVRWVSFFIMAASMGLIYLLVQVIPSELAPAEDRGQLRLYTTGPEGSTFEFMDRYLDRLVEMVQTEVPEVQGIVSVTSPGYGASSATNSGFMRIILKPQDERQRSQQEVLDFLQKKVSDYPTGRTFVSQEQSIGGSRGGLPVQFVIQAQTLEKLRGVLPSFLEQAKQDSTFAFVNVDLKFNKPELRVSIKRNKARSLGVSVEDIARTLQLGLSGQRFDYFIMNGQQYYVIGQLDRRFRNDPDDLRSVYVRNDAGRMIQLSNLIEVEESTTPPQLFRYNRYSAATLSAALAEGRTLGEGIAAMERIADEVLDDTYATALAGPSQEFAESTSSLDFAFALALVLIFLVLAAQFESFRDPLIILFTVPLALAGALLALWYTEGTLNIFSQIGIIMLIGLVSKNAILIVEFANQRKAAGLSRLDAIKEAAESRFRPILMTSLSTILGVLPIALALGAGAESRTSMGIAVIGGLLFSTALTLYVIPAIYSYLSEKEKAVSNVDEAVLEG